MESVFSSAQLYKSNHGKINSQPNLFMLVGIFFFSLCLAFVSPSVLADDLKAPELKTQENSLFEARIPAPVPKDGADDQPMLIQQAFKNMLVRASGSEKILQKPAVIKALSEVDTYVSRFSYEINANQDRLLKVRFDEVLCNQLIKGTGQPLLSKKRSPVVLWLVMQQNNDKQWIGGDSQNELSHQLEGLAEKRGLSFVYPLLDLTDTAIISEQDVWNEKLDVLQQASKRYNADQLLIGKLSKQPSGWYGQWTYVRQGTAVHWDMSNTELATIFSEALDEFSLRSTQPMLAKAGADKDKANKNNGIADSSDINASAGTSGEADGSMMEGKPKTLRLVIAGVSDGAQYAKILKYLQTLPSVKSVEVAEINPDQTVFKMNTTAEIEDVAKMITADQLLEEVPGSLHSKESLNYKVATLIQ